MYRPVWQHLPRRARAVSGQKAVSFTAMSSAHSRCLTKVWRTGGRGRETEAGGPEEAPEVTGTELGVLE